MSLKSRYFANILNLFYKYKALILQNQRFVFISRQKM